MQEQLSAQKLHELNKGAAGIVINQEIQTALKDLLDRGPEDHKVRKVNITLTIGLIDNGDVGCYVEANHQLPKRRTKSTIVKIKCAVDIDLPAGKFALIPLPEEIEQAQDATMRKLATDLSALLTTQDCPIFYGSDTRDQ